MSIVKCKRPVKCAKQIEICIFSAIVRREVIKIAPLEKDRRQSLKTLIATVEHMLQRNYADDPRYRIKKEASNSQLCFTISHRRWPRHFSLCLSSLSQFHATFTLRSDQLNATRNLFVSDKSDMHANERAARVYCVSHDVG